MYMFSRQSSFREYIREKTFLDIPKSGINIGKLRAGPV